MKNIFALALALMIFSFNTYAQERERPSSNFVGLQYVYGVADVEDVSGGLYFGEGGQLDASYAFDDFVLVRGSYYTGSGEYRGGPDIDYTTGRLGIGLLAPTDDPVAIDASIEYRNDEIEVDDEDTDLDGLGLTFGLRAAVTDAQDVGVRFGVYAGDYDQAVTVELNYAYNFSENWAITAGYEYIDITPDDSNGVSLDKWLIGGRFIF